MICPNKESKEYKELAAAVGDNYAHYLWDKYQGEVPLKYYNLSSVGYTLKAGDIILNNLKKINSWWSDKSISKDKFWEKLQKDLQIPKDQLELLKNSEGSSPEEKFTSFMANYSYTVEINTAKRGGLSTSGQQYYEVNRWGYWYSPDFNNRGYYKRFEQDESTLTKITKEEYEIAKNNADNLKNTDYYSNLTVPGGTNYIENEIATPAITPSIKGHAQFSTDSGIGWFRSDEQGTTKDKERENLAKKQLEEDINNGFAEPNQRALRLNSGEGTKTRRILEIQSDLFQKGRDRSDLVNYNEFGRELADEDSYSIPYNGKTYIAQAAAGYYAYERFEGDGNYTYPLPLSSWPQEVKDELEKQREEKKKLANKATGFEEQNENQFLQLLNKNNNWVRFFIQSIIQDSAKKGYEKVLFPLGDTASKVEGHTTLEEFKKQKEDRIKELEKEPFKVFTESGLIEGIFKTEQEAIALKEKLDSEVGYDIFIEDSKNEINQLKQELERVEREGFGALKSIFNFYENTVNNILKKLGNVNQITDEYGNTWNEVDLSEEKILKSVSPIMLSKDAFQTQLEEYLRGEHTKDLLFDLTNLFPELPDRKEFGQTAMNFIWQKELDNLKTNRSSVKVVGNSIFPVITPTSKRVTSEEQLAPYGRSIVNFLNKRHFSKTFGGIATYREYPKGNVWVEPSFSSRYLDFLYRALENSVKNKARQEEYKEVDAVEALERLEDVQRSWVNRQIDGGFMEVDGEIIPLDPTYFSQLSAYQQVLSKKEIQNYENVINKLASRFKGVTWEWDASINSAGQVDVDSGNIKLNPNLINPSTPWHEVGHIFVRGIRFTNPELFEELKKDLERLHEKHGDYSAISLVKSNYPELIGTEEFWEEVITTELGLQSTKPKNFFQKIWDYVLSLFKDYKINKLKTNLTIEDLTKIFTNEFLQFSVEETEGVFEQRITPPEVEEISNKLTNDFDEVYKDLATKIKEIDWKKILNTSQQLFRTRSAEQVEKGTLSLPERALQRILENNQLREYITPDSISEAVLDYVNYVQMVALYMQSLKQNLETSLEDKELTDKQKLTILFFTNQLSEVFTKQISVLDSKLLNGVISGRNPLSRAKLNILAFSKDIETIYDRETVEKVSDVLSKHFTPQLVRLVDSYDNRIKKLETAKSEHPSKASYFDKRINKLKEQKKKIPTRENLPHLLKNPSNNYLGLFFTSAQRTRSTGVQAIATYLVDTLKDSEKDYHNELNTLQSIFEDIQKEEGGQALDSREFNKPYQRVVDEVFVNEEGNLDTRKILVLNSQMDEQKLLNKITELEFEISRETDLDKLDSLEKDYKDFLRKYAERPYTDEYYAIQDLLPQRIRDKRNKIIEDINAAYEGIGFSGATEESINLIVDLKKDLYDLERIHDQAGNLKSGQDYDDALIIQDWKNKRFEKETTLWKLTNDSKKAFGIQLRQQKFERDRVLNNSQSTDEQVREALEKFTYWSKLYTSTVYDKEFYEEREKILYDISEIYKKYDESSISEKFEDLFVLLKGYRDSNRVYDGNLATEELKRKSQVIEKEIERLKKLAKEENKFSKDDRNELSRLFKLLKEIQITVDTDYYKDRREAIRNQIFSEIAREYVSQKKEATKEEVALEVEKRYANSAWFKDNHIEVEEYDKSTRTYRTVMRPLTIWRMTMPAKEAWIKKEEPSQYWYRPYVNPVFKNPNYKWGQHTFKVVDDDYYNKNYDNLTIKQKDNLRRLTDFYLKLQEPLYKRYKLGLKQPQIRKENWEQMFDIVTLRNTPQQFIKKWWHTLKDLFTVGDTSSTDYEDQYGEEEIGIDGNPVTNQQKRLYLRFNKTLPIEEASFDLSKNLALFSAEAIKFKHLKQNQSIILSAQQVVPEEKSNIRKTLDSFIDRALYGKNVVTQFDPSTSGGKTMKVLNSIGNMILSKVGQMSLQFNALSAVKNYVAGLLQDLTQSGLHDLNMNDLRRGFVKAHSLAGNFFLYEMQAGNKSYELRLLDYFNVLQKNPEDDAIKIKNTFLRKRGNPFKTVQTFRQLGEFEIQATIAFAFLKKFTVKKKDSDQEVPLLEAYEVVDNKIQARPDIDIPEAYERMVRSKIDLFNERSQGLYRRLYQPHGQKIFLYRTLMFMKKWFVPSLEARYEAETIHVGSGIATKGYKKALWDFLGDIYQTRGNVSAVLAGLTETEQRALTTNIKDIVILSALMGLTRLSSGSDDDDNQDYKDYLSWLLKNVTDEYESVGPAAAFEFAYGFILNRSNGKNWAARIGDKTLGPLERIPNILFDSNLWTTDPFYKYYPNSSKINWDRTNPFYAGKNSLAVLFLKLYGADQASLTPTQVEYKSRQFSKINPKIYVPENTKRYTTDYRKVMIKHKKKNDQRKSD